MLCLYIFLALFIPVITVCDFSRLLSIGSCTPGPSTILNTVSQDTGEYSFQIKMVCILQNYY